MSNRLLQMQEKRVPRYTSYPTAPHFHTGITPAIYENWLQSIDAEDHTSLYIHIPYCHEMCWYCGCHTKISKRYQPIQNYVQTLRAEIALIAKSLKTKPLLTHLHWGGGTPTILSATDFTNIMEDLRAVFTFTQDAEIAVEIDPRTLTAEMIGALSKTGVTRASLGVQDCNHHVQVAINRIQPFEQTADVVTSLRAAGIGKINFDLIYGLPSQTVEDVGRTVELATSLAPDRLAVFGYAHVPWMKTHQKLIDEATLPSGEDRLRQATAIADELTSRGYCQIGLDHFAREDDTLSNALNTDNLRRNFQGYTTDQAAYLIGIGASAIGSMQQGYVQNNPDIGTYTDSVMDGKLPVVRGIELAGEDRLRRQIIETLMCDLAVDLKALSIEFGIDEGHFSTELAALAEYIDGGLVEVKNGVIEITETGRPWMRLVCAVFDQYLETGQARHSAAV